VPEKSEEGMEILELLRNSEIFQGLSEKQRRKMEPYFQLQTLASGEFLFHQGEKADKLYLVKEGFLEVLIQRGTGSGTHAAAHLGAGESIGEMSWVDRGRRSGTVRAISPWAEVASITFTQLDEICGQDFRIGFLMMRNIAVDLSFRLRQRDLVLL
jgi:CRP/FNR family cyclic AMP-dependent transcriptional regulator